MAEDALAAATHIRLAREELVAAIRAGQLDLATVGGGPDVDQVKIVVLAEAVPGVGKVKARSILDSLGVAHATRWGELGSRRAAVLAALVQVPGEGR